MSVIDVSRYLSQPGKHYRTVHMQQGRVILDSDWNENGFIEDESDRRVHRDLIGPRGTSNEGFLIRDDVVAANVIDPDGNPVGSYDFTIEPGSFFIGGSRFELDQAERFLKQSDWLQADGADIALPPPRGLPKPPSVGDLNAAPGNVLHDFVYLCGWEQDVTATEDAELIEPALGGPDTSTRTRLTRRVQILPRTRGTCPEAFEDLIASITAPVAPDPGPSHTFDRIDSRLVSKTKLTVTFDTTGATDDPCRPTVLGGFLGAENETIRVQLVGSDRFVWGRDDASPLYRVEVEDDGAGLKVVRFVSGPRDQAAEPLVGQVVEILPWSAILPNSQKIADLRGHLSKVESSYDPVEKTITITTPVPPEWANWLALSPTHDDLESNQDDPKDYFYLRLWTGVDGDQPDGSRQFAGTVPKPLGSTGLFVTFSDFGLPGEYWVIAARPHTPLQVVPWELMTGAPSVGPIFSFAPLAIIHWSLEGGNVVGHPEDCRARFDALTELGCCCTFTVGDGTTSHGDFTSINDALAHLPLAGGEICVRPGKYLEHVKVDKDNVTIKGCGPRSRIVGPDATAPTVEIVGSESVRIEGFAIEAAGGSAGVRVTRTEPPSREITLTRLFVEAGPGPCIEIQRAEGAQIADCVARMRDVGPGEPHAVYVEGERLRVERNRILVLPLADDPKDQLGRGGLQVGGDSHRVLVSHNLIRRGTGNGITLGSVVLEDGTTTPGGFVPGEDPCAPGETFVPGEEGEPTRHPAGSLEDVRIEDNTIREMGLNGIGVAEFFDLRTTPEMIFVDGLRIMRNRIRDCLARPLADIPGFMQAAMGYGGIALADVRLLVVHDNVIEQNGEDRREPICGVYVLHAEGADLHRNHIMNDRPMEGGFDGVQSGVRGGIWIQAAIAPTIALLTVVDMIDSVYGYLPAQDGTPAVRVHANVVASPLGRALTAVALGPVTVVGNQLTSRATTGDGLIPSMLVGTVLLFDLGVSNELYWQRQDRIDAPVVTTLVEGELPRVVDDNLVIPGRTLDAVLDIIADGNVLFTDNQVLLSQLEPGQSLALVSIAIFSLDDVGFENNQCECVLAEAEDFVIDHVFLFGLSVRLIGNRLKEGLRSAAWSAVSIGVLQVMATNNESTHCFITIGIMREVANNLHLVDLLAAITGEGAMCEKMDFRRIAPGFGEPKFMAIR